MPEEQDNQIEHREPGEISEKSPQELWENIEHDIHD
jgi:hypothetical protein